MALLVTYDLQGLNRDYAGLINELKRAPGIGWWHYLESTWIIATDETPSQLWKRIEPHIHDGDRVLILEIQNPPRQGWLPQRAWRWLRSHLIDNSGE
jgi:hypothetical protein